MASVESQNRDLILDCSLEAATAANKFTRGGVALAMIPADTTIKVRAKRSASAASAASTNSLASFKEQKVSAPQATENFPPHVIMLKSSDSKEIIVYNNQDGPEAEIKDEG